MSERDVGREILDGLREIKNHKRDGKPLRKTILREASHPKEIREKLKLSQSAFASLMGVTPQTIQAWENGERTPRGPAKPLLRIAEQHPEIFLNMSE
jgi:putative transcriptional regulator